MPRRGWRERRVYIHHLGRRVAPRHREARLKNQRRPADIQLREFRRSTTPNGKVLTKVYDIKHGRENVGVLKLDVNPHLVGGWGGLATDRDVGIAWVRITNTQRGKGVGRATLKKVENIARKNNKQRVILAAYDWNTKAQKFYRNAGYTALQKVQGTGKRTVSQPATLTVFTKELNNEK